MASTQSPSPTTASSSGGDAKPQERPPESWRDTFEQVIFAFVLALVFRTFEAEAFVIPTGSMAPTLYGRHKEAPCEQCGIPVTVTASSEVDRDSGLLNGIRVEGAICPNCRYPNTDFKDARVFNGDRILVNKFPYSIGDPDRFDVFVFKYPNEPATNYIKRLVGLPNETLRISGGDLFQVQADGSEKVLRKEPKKQRAIQILVHDNDHRSPMLDSLGCTPRWEPVLPVQPDVSPLGWGHDESGWTSSEDGRSFDLEAGNAAMPKWVRYRHLPPSSVNWGLALGGKKPALEPALISDFCGYNSDWQNVRQSRFDAVVDSEVEQGVFWVGDLTVNFDLELSDITPESEVVIELCEGYFVFRCYISPNDGKARLVKVATINPAEEIPMGEGETSIDGAGSYAISFANVDDRLCLWIDNSLVAFSDKGEYVTRPAERKVPQMEDMTPVGISATSLSAQLTHLRIERDIYYRAARNSDETFSWDQRQQLSLYLSSPRDWKDSYSLDTDTVEIEIGPDAYLALGDNSPQSSDSRFWSKGRQTVPAEYLVGKAFWIYWPHGVPFMNDGKGYPITNQSYAGGAHPTDEELEKGYPGHVFPFYPNISRMKRIR